MLGPIGALLNAQEGGVLATIVGVEGPSYRPLGAQMFISADGARVDNLSSGCIEADIEIHAQECLESGEPLRLLYGRGSPFIDVRLPCGGGLEILLIPNPDRKVLGALHARQNERKLCGLKIDLASGSMELADIEKTCRSAETLEIRIDPPIKYLIFGKGPEAETFAKLVASSGFTGTLVSPDEETLDSVDIPQIEKQLLRKNDAVDISKIDNWTAVTLFFHDHEWEPPILEAVLNSSAFYIGAQGSAKARADRDQVLVDRGVSPAEISRIRGPIGLIPSARDATTLAVSVLAETLADGHLTEGLLSR